MTTIDTKYENYWYIYRQSNYVIIYNKKTYEAFKMPFTKKNGMIYINQDLIPFPFRQARAVTEDGIPVITKDGNWLDSSLDLYTAEKLLWGFKTIEE